MKLLKELTKPWLAFLYPPKCALCTKELTRQEKGICRHCYESRHMILDSYCHKCGKNINTDDEYCCDCQRKEHEFEQGHGLFPYNEIKDAVLKMKYQKQKWRAVELARLMAWLYEAEIRQWQIEAVTCVPQDFLSLGEKGYNPPAEIAAELAKQWNLPVLKQALQAHHKHKSQKKLSIPERKSNLAGVFSCKQPIKFRKVLIIDDVYTTGATIDTCSRLLKHSGVEKVYFLTLAIGSYQD